MKIFHTNNFTLLNIYEHLRQVYYTFIGDRLCDRLTAAGGVKKLFAQRALLTITPSGQARKASKENRRYKRNLVIQFIPGKWYERKCKFY